MSLTKKGDSREKERPILEFLAIHRRKPRQYHQALTREEKVAILQREVDEAKAIMEENIARSLENGDKIEALEEKADNLNIQSQGFQRNANKVKRNRCCAVIPF